MRFLKFLFLLLLIAAGGLAAAYWQARNQPLPLAAERIEFTIPLGTGLNGAATVIERAGAGIPAWRLALLARALGVAGQIKAGSYEISQGLTAYDLLGMLVRGEVSLGRITLVEGRTWREFRAQLDSHPDLNHDSATLADAAVAQQLGLNAPSPEGWLRPETYRFDKRSSDLDLLRRAVADQQAVLSDAWATRDPALPLRSPEELLVLASIVEKETGLAADRPAIAAVFVNRLRIGMPLQSDPTVIYGLGSAFDGDLRRVDLRRDTPWNTYTRSGLPPTPICMPSEAALRITARPPSTPHLYFVARGDGSSEFSSTLDAHNRAVAQYQKALAR